MDRQAQKILEMLSELFPKAEMHRMLDELAARRMSWTSFRTFVWHKMAKTAAERVAGRRWELVDGDLRHSSARLSVIYAMHCIYERAAKGCPPCANRRKGADLWTWGSKAG